MVIQQLLGKMIMNERIRELELQAMSIVLNSNDPDGDVDKMYIPTEFTKKFAELIIRECINEVEQAKNSPFVSLDDAKRMKHFVDITKKKIQKHFEVE